MRRFSNNYLWLLIILAIFILGQALGANGIFASDDSVPNWQSGASYGLGSLVIYNGQIYNCIVAHTSQNDWVPDRTAGRLWEVIPKDNVWQQYVHYKVGNIVCFAGKYYKCIQEHTTMPNWDPPKTPALWSFSCEPFIKVNITVTGSGSVTKNPDQTHYHYNDKVVLTAKPSDGWVFDHWEGSLTGNTNPATITVSVGTDIKAIFKQIPYSLTVQISGNGTVTKDPAKDTYFYNDKVTLTANPIVGWKFDHWEGGVTGTVNNVTITIKANISVKAVFIPIEYSLTITKVGNGTVTKNPDKSTYHYGDQVVLTAKADNGWKFDHWESGATGTASNITITVYGNTSIKAVFIPIEYTLTITKIGNGTVTVKDVKSTYHYGDIVQLTANADTGWAFIGWGSDAANLTNPLNVTINGNTTVIANFKQLEYTLTITKVGNGTVALDPAKSTYHYGDTVKLTASGDSGWEFAGWGSDSANKTNPLTMTVNGNTNQTANFKQKEYNLTITKVGNGTVAIKNPKPTYHFGDTVQLTATADPGWAFIGWGNDTANQTNPQTITISGDTNVTANFKQIEYTLNITKVGNGAITVKDAKSTYHYGDAIQLTASGDPGWEFVGWGSDSADTTNPLTITITGNTNFIANFKLIEYTLTVNQNGGGTVTKTPEQLSYHYGDTITLKAGTIDGWVFQGWSGGVNSSDSQVAVTIKSDTTVTATFSLIPYSLIMNKVGNGIITTDPAKSVYYYGDTVKLVANSDPGWKFDHWSDGASGNTSATTVTIKGNTTVTANFSWIEYTFNITKVGNGSIALDPAKSTYHYGDTVHLTASGDPGWEFVGWGSDSADKTNPLTITVTGNTNPTANFKQKEYNLTITKVGNGTVAIKDPKPTYHYGDTVQLTATADPGWAFMGWGNDAANQTNPQIITISGDTNVTANFKQIEYNLIVNQNGGGTVTKTPDQLSYHYGDTVTLKADTIAGWSFSGWSGGVNSSDSQVTVTIKGDTTVTATFSLIPYTLNVTKVGNGTFTVEPQKSVYYYGDTVKLTATGDPGWKFDSWSSGASGNTNVITVNINGNTTVTANFSLIEYTLSVTKVGNGTILFDSTKATYHYGDTVKLVANGDPGWKFDHWSDGASGNTSATTVTIKGNTTVTANFSWIEYTFNITKVGNGSVALDPVKSTYHYGDIVRMTASGDLGWDFVGWSSDSADKTNPLTITVTGNTNPTANFKQKEYNLTITKVGNGTVAIKDPKPTYHYGDLVQLTATADPGWSFIGWGNDATNQTNLQTITISGDTNVTANFKQIEYTLAINTVGTGLVIQNVNKSTYHYGDTITLSAQAGAGWRFYQWDGVTGDGTSATVTIAGNTIVTATFIPLGYTLTVDQVGGGTITKTPDQLSYQYGDTVTLKASASDGWVFKGWSGGVTSSASQITVVIKDDTVITATFTLVPYSLTINQMGKGTVTADPQKDSYYYGDTVKLTATGVPGWKFDNWSGGASGNTKTVTVTINGDTTVTANFSLIEYVLNVNNVGTGTVAQEPNKSTYHYGDTVTLIPQAGIGQQFSQWTGANGNATSATVTITGDTNVTATFIPIEYVLKVVDVGSGTVTQTPNHATYHYGDIVTLNPQAGTGWQFSTWDGATGDGTSATVKITGNTTVTANFIPVEYVLNVIDVGTGTVTQDLNKTTYHYGDVITFTPQASIGWQFSTWDGATGDATSATVTITGNTTVTATFIPIEYVLKVVDVGSGTVTQTPNHATYHYGDIVTLNPQAGTGWQFSTWDGATGDGTSATVKITGNTTVTATFIPIEYTLAVKAVGTGVVSQTPNQTTYHYGDVVTLTPQAATGWNFSSWDGATGNGTSASVTIKGNTTVTATFISLTYTLNIMKDGNGTVTTDSTQPTYQYGDQVTFTATPADGWQFTGWSGDLTGNNNPAVLAIQGNATVNGVFKVATVGDLAIRVDYKNVNLSWSSPSAVSTILVLRKTGGYPASPTDGTVVFNGKGSAYVDPNLTNGTYYYAVYASVGGQYSDGVNGSAVINITSSGSSTTTPDGKTIIDFQPNDSNTYSKLKTALNYENDDCTFWNGKTVLIGRGMSSRMSDVWFRYPSLIGSNIGQVSTNALIERAKLVIKIKGFTGDKNKLRHLRIYTVIDPNNLGTPWYGSINGVNGGLNYKYRDSANQILWANGIVNIMDLFKQYHVVPIDTIDYLPASYINNGVTTLEFNVTESMKTWLNNQTNEGWFITTDEAEWSQGEQIELYGTSADNISDRPYFDVYYATTGDVQGPATVSNLNANIGDGQLLLTWKNPTDDFYGVKVIRKQGVAPRDPEDGELVYDGLANSCRQVALTNGITYYYAVFAYDNRRNYSQNAWIKVTPGAPGASIIYQSQVGNGLVNLSWSSTVPMANSYRVYRQAADENNPRMLAEVIGTNFIDYHVETKVYTYWVTGVNENGEGPLSIGMTVTMANIAVQAPKSPILLTVNSIPSNSTQMQLTWIDGFNDETAFAIERKLASGGSWIEIGRVSFDQYNFIDSYLQPGTAYQYQIKAVNSNPVASDYVGPVVATTSYTPVAPMGLDWKVVKGTQVNLNWSDSPNKTSYTVDVLDSNGALITEYKNIITNSYSVINLKANTAYHFKVIAVNSSGTAESITELVITTLL